MLSRGLATGPELLELAARHGGCASNALRDPRYRVFVFNHLEAAIAYRATLGCAVAIGDPVTRASSLPSVEEAFRAECAASRRAVAYAGASPQFTQVCVARDYAALEFAEELICDPCRDPQAGGGGRELRKKVQRAAREGVIVEEYRRDGLPDPAIESALEETVAHWRAARRGPQSYIAHVTLFETSFGRRWFRARTRARTVGVLVLTAIRDGWLIEHLIARPDAPAGTTETLASHALAQLGAEGCHHASFGISPRASLGAAVNLTSTQSLVARKVFAAADHFLHLSMRSRYRRKFQPSACVPAYLLFHPARLGPREVLALSCAFNVSLSWRPHP
jgi:lysylphosphatidylglycerol synthetase-like protein (DUF2156 family)